MSRSESTSAESFDFCGRTFHVERDTHQPGIGAELLVDVALEEGYGPVLEFGTGAGCVLLSLVAPRYATSGVGVDASFSALELARRNYDELGIRYNSHGLLRQVFFTEGSLYDGVPTEGGGDSWADDLADDERVSGYGATDGLVAPMRFHLIAVALPYPSDDRLDVLRAVAAGACEHLERDGRVIVEVEPVDAQAAIEVFLTAGLRGVETRCDVEGVERVVIGRLADQLATSPSA